jgi:hypothetical protein
METQNYCGEKLRNCFLKAILAISFIFTFLYKAGCQESGMPESAFKGGSYENTFSTVRIGVAQSVMTVPKGEFHLVILHRFKEISSNANDFFGLDNAWTRLGFDYGIFNWLSAGIGRSMTLQTYDLALKALMLKQNESNMPVSLSWYGSALEDTKSYPAFLGHDSFGERLSFVNQLTVARNQGIFSLQAAPLWVHTNYNRDTESPLDIFALELDTRIRFTEMLALVAEYIPIFTNETFTQTDPFTIGLDINTGHHQFQLLFGNSQATDELSVLTNTEGSWSKGHIYFGFNLTRVFNAKVY